MRSDPYRYFRIEARELLDGLNQGILELERGVVNPELVGRLLRLAHTLKGASRVVKQIEIGNLAHSVEGALTSYRETQGPVPRQRINDVLRLLDDIGSRLSMLDRAGEPERPGLERASPEGAFETVRVELREMDSLLGGLSETTASLSALRACLDGIGRALARSVSMAEMLAGPRSPQGNGAGGITDARLRSLVQEIQEYLKNAKDRIASRLDNAERQLSLVRETADSLRLLPASSIFSALERAIRDAAQSLGKQVEFHSSGGENRLDAHVLATIREGLIQIVRNAVAHGIETEAERAASGKAMPGRVELQVERRGNRAAFICKDDGRGIDVEAVREAAVRGKLVSKAQAESLSLEQVIQLMLKGGVTTTSTVTDVSGRGVGLDVVREALARLKGDVRLHTLPRHGTTLELSVPISLSSLESILVEATGTGAAIPLDSVCTTLRVSENDIVRSADRDSVFYEGAAVPCVALAQLLGRESTRRHRVSHRSAVVLRSGSELAALEVEHILGTARVVARPLPSWIRTNELITGGALDAEGQPVLLLDPKGIVKASRTQSGRTAEKPALRPRILIIDDSLTSRMLEQSILESAGYEVDAAASGEEALGKAGKRTYGVFVVDIEMTGMDGFEFIAETRTDPVLRGTPSILVTSRSSEEDRRRAENLGARAYIVKSEFDQGHLLKVIQELIG